MKSLDRITACITAGGILTLIECVFGKVDYSMIFLFIVMVTDFATGTVCGWMERKLSSRVCVNGLFRKLMILAYVMLGHHLDVLLHLDYIRVGVCYMYSISECISIFENGVKLGVPIPEPIKKALDMLNKKG